MTSSLSSSNIRKLYEEAEEALKRYERISLANLAPALNELRYAGHHLLEADDAGTETDKLQHLTRAKAHCERARYDAKEATIISLLECVADLIVFDCFCNSLQLYVM